MAYQALYRKWRPLTFDDVIGQSYIVNTLKNEIIEKKIAHAYLFTGTRGTGKTSTAKILSRAVNCENLQDGNPCNCCETCKSILDGSVLDIIEIDAASNTGVDNIREIIEQCQYASVSTKYKVYIIDEVHMLSSGAFNALLKTLEEPPSHVIFILATTEIHMVPATILSRCQRFDFSTISVSDIVMSMKRMLGAERIDVDEDALEYVAYLGNGSMRDSLSILDRCIAFKNEKITYEDVVGIVGALDDSVLYKFAQYICNGDVKNLLVEFDKCVASGKSLDNFSVDLLNVYREMLKYINIGTAHKTSAKRMQLIDKTSKLYTQEKLVRCIYILTDLIHDLRFVSNARVLIECALIKMANPVFDIDEKSILDRISVLEKKISSGEFVSNTNNISNVIESFEPIMQPDEMPVEQEIVQDEETEKKQDSENDAVDNIISNWSDVISRVQDTKELVMYFHISDAVPKKNREDLVLMFSSKEKKDDFERSSDNEKLGKIITEIFGFCPKILSTSAANFEEFVEESDTNNDDLFLSLEKRSDDFPENIKFD